LAFFAHESSYGTKGICKDYDTKSWGNVRTPHQVGLAAGVVSPPGRGTFAKYLSWESGLRDWCLRITEKYIGQLKADTVEKAIPVYAPSLDGNTPTAYINAVRALVEQWSSEDSALLSFNDQYYNKSANQEWRSQPMNDFVGVIWHETASPNPDNPHGTLSYNLEFKIRSSYNYLVARDGTIFRYIDEVTRIAYHAGVNSFVAIDGTIYRGSTFNVHFIGVEIDGANDGTPITEEQRDAIVQLMIFFSNERGIPIDPKFHLGHKDVAPGYKSDPRGYNVKYAVSLAQKAVSVAQKKVIAGSTRDFTCSAYLYDYYTKNGGVVLFGYPLSDEFTREDQAGEMCSWMRFENAVVKVKLSQTTPWDIRPASLSELLALGIIK
jgi:hypothetical protein